jgi:hypothetical protein
MAISQTQPNHIATLGAPANPASAASRKRAAVGWAISALPLALLIFSGSVKLMNIPAVVETNAKLGIAPGTMVAIGIVELLCTLLYLFPRTAPLGAILLTGYLGGATATHVLAGDAFYFPVLVGVLLWGGLYLRSERLRRFLLPEG